jgi:hypothetical protein
MSLVFLASDLLAQESLYVTLNNSKGYVVGAKLQESGIFHWIGDTTWTHIGWNHPFIGGLAFVDGPDGIIHAAAGNGEMRSSDGGQTWKITTGWEVTEAQHIALDRGDPRRIYLATSYGIWTSRNSGDNWRQVTDVYTQAVVADNFTERRAISATERGLWLTENGGDTWRMVGQDNPTLDVAQSPTLPQEWIAGTRSDGIWRSSDGGENWSMSLDLDSSVTAVAIDPARMQRMAAATWGAGLFITQDGGNTWTNRKRGLPTSQLVEVTFDGARTGRLWVGTVERGVFYTDNLGASWTYAGMNGTMVFDMVYPQ